MLPIINIFGKDIGTYAICAVIGVLVCSFLAYFLLRKYKVEYEDLILTIVAIVVGVLVGGHLLYAITNINNAASLISVNGFWRGIVYLFGGAVYYGGFLGAIFGIAIYNKISKSKTAKLNYDVYAVFTPLFHVFGRIGCFLGGCCFGIESTWGFVVHNNTIVPEINDVKRVPIALIEAFFNLLIFVVIFILFKKEKLQGELLYIYMLIYPFVRFVDEFYRGDAIRGIWFGLSTSQWISIVLFVVAISHFLIKKAKMLKFKR